MRCEDAPCCGCCLPYGEPPDDPSTYYCDDCGISHVGACQFDETSNGFCDECGANIIDGPPGQRRVCPRDSRHDCYGDNFANGGDPIPEAC